MTSALFADMAVMAPEIILAVGTMALMIVGAYSRGAGTFKVVATLAVALWASAGAYVWISAGDEVVRAFNDSIVIDMFARVAKTLITLGTAAALMIALADIKGTIMARFEYPVLMSFSMLGMYLMVSANDFLMLYVGLELSSLALYVLAAFNRNSSASSEAGLKYFVLGAISSGLILFGISLLYGFTGSLQFDLISSVAGAVAVPVAPTIVTFGMVMVLAGMTFKIAAVPFHMWTPDVYEGAPTAVTAFFAIVPKLAAMVLLARLLFVPFGGLQAEWQPILSFMAVASMIVGGFAAIVQTNLKRLLAYSSISNVGYALIGLAIGTQDGLASMLVYMTIYMVGTIGVFGIILLLKRDGFGINRIEDLAGLSRTKPGMAYALAALMFSYSGIPPLAGFFGKLAVFQAAVSAEAYILAVVGVVTSVVAAWYYINIIRVMFFDTANDTTPNVSFSLSLAGVVMVVCSLGFTALFIFVPGPLSNLAMMATTSLLP